MVTPELVETVILLVIPLYLFAIILYVIRIVKGPSVPDIVLAIDCLSYDVAAFMAILGIYYRSVFLVIVALPLALWGYALDIFVSKYLEKRELGT